jgi:hypothetical protein
LALALKAEGRRKKAELKAEARPWFEVQGQVKLGPQVPLYTLNTSAFCLLPLDAKLDLETGIARISAPRRTE